MVFPVGIAVLDLHGVIDKLRESTDKVRTRGEHTKFCDPAELFIFHDVEKFTDSIPARYAVVYSRYYIELLCFCNIEEGQPRVRSFRLESGVSDQRQDFLVRRSHHPYFVQEFAVAFPSDV